MLRQLTASSVHAARPSGTLGTSATMTRRRALQTSSGRNVPHQVLEARGRNINKLQLVLNVALLRLWREKVDLRVVAEPAAPRAASAVSSACCGALLVLVEGMRRSCGVVCGVRDRNEQAVGSVGSKLRAMSPAAWAADGKVRSSFDQAAT